jgi:hypothetical protein
MTMQELLTGRVRLGMRGAVMGRVGHGRLRGRMKEGWDV